MKLEISVDRTNFQPGEIISGRAFWELKSQPFAIEVRLLWYTEGKGIQDLCIVQRIPINNSELKQEYLFQMKAPDAPYSFSGKLISLIWAVSLICNNKESERAKIVIAPEGKEVLLYKNGL